MTKTIRLRLAGGAHTGPLSTGEAMLYLCDIVTKCEQQRGQCVVTIDARHNPELPAQGWQCVVTIDARDLEPEGQATEQEEGG